MITVFVYGTLLAGESNHAIIAPYVLAAAPGHVRGWLYNVGDYPALVLDDNGEEIEGEWLELSDEALVPMDELEGYGGVDADNDYERVVASDSRNAGQSGWIYVWRESRGCRRIEGGSWRRHQRRSRF